MEGSLVRFGDHQQYFEVEFVLLQNEVWQVEPGAAARRVSALMSEWGVCGVVEWRHTNSTGWWRVPPDSSLPSNTQQYPPESEGKA